MLKTISKLSLLNHIIIICLLVAGGITFFIINIGTSNAQEGVLYPAIPADPVQLEAWNIGCKAAGYAQGAAWYSIDSYDENGRGNYFYCVGPQTPSDVCGTNENGGMPYYAYRKAYNEYKFTNGTFCEKGTPTPTNPDFPEIGKTVSWVCKLPDGTGEVSCAASRVGLQYSETDKFVTTFGGKNDKGVTRTETGSVTGVNLRSLPDDAMYAAYPLDEHIPNMPLAQTNPDKIEGENFNNLLKSYYLKVTNSSNGKTVILPIIDRGPKDSVKIDISPRARRLLGITDNNDGIMKVNTELILTSSATPTGSNGEGMNASINYTVKPGDTIRSIAAAYGTTVTEIKNANPDIKNISNLQPGQIIIIPNPTIIPSASISTVSPSPTVVKINRASSTVVSSPVMMKPYVSTSIFCGGRIDLKWNAIAGARYYNIYRGTNAGNLKQIKTGVVDTRYTDISGQGRFYYKVSAMLPSGESALSTFGFADASKVCGPSKLRSIPGNIWQAIMNLFR